MITLVVEECILEREPQLQLYNPLILPARCWGANTLAWYLEEELRIEVEESLLITTSPFVVEEATKMGLATLPYRSEDSDATFPDAWIVAEGLEDADDVFFQHAYERFHHIPWRILETKRCYLREFCMDDMDDLYRIYAGEGITDYMEPLYERAEEEAYERAYIDAMYRFYGYGMWLVCRKSDDVIIGRAGLEHRDFPEGAELEMGYMIAAEEQRKGYATEVCSAIVAYAEEELEFDRVNCLIEPGNRASIALLEKMGFRPIGETLDFGKPMIRYIKD